jgi:hypothetical protein
LKASSCPCGAERAGCVATEEEVKDAFERIITFLKAQLA